MASLGVWFQREFLWWKNNSTVCSIYSAHTSFQWSRGLGERNEWFLSKNWRNDANRFLLSDSDLRQTQNGKRKKTTASLGQKSLGSLQVLSVGHLRRTFFHQRMGSASAFKKNSAKSKFESLVSFPVLLEDGIPWRKHESAHFTQHAGRAHKQSFFSYRPGDAWNVQMGNILKVPKFHVKYPNGSLFLPALLGMKHLRPLQVYCLCLSRRPKSSFYQLEFRRNSEHKQKLVWQVQGLAGIAATATDFPISYLWNRWTKLHHMWEISRANTPYLICHIW